MPFYNYDDVQIIYVDTKMISFLYSNHIVSNRFIHILFGSTVDVKLRAIFEIKQPREEVDTGFVEKIPQLVKFMEVDDINKKRLFILTS